jgi:hypothetical protein
MSDRYVTFDRDERGRFSPQVETPSTSTGEQALGAVICMAIGAGLVAAWDHFFGDDE